MKEEMEKEDGEFEEFDVKEDEFETKKAEGKLFDNPPISILTHYCL